MSHSLKISAPRLLRFGIKSVLKTLNYNRKYSQMNKCFPETQWLILLYSELLKAEVVKLHGCVIFLRICAKFSLLKAKQEKISTFLCFWFNWTKFFKNFTCFIYGILGPFLCAKLSVWNFSCAKEFAFRRSDSTVLYSLDAVWQPPELWLPGQ